MIEIKEIKPVKTIYNKNNSNKTQDSGFSQALEKNIASVSQTQEIELCKFAPLLNDVSPLLKENITESKKLLEKLNKLRTILLGKFKLTELESYLIEIEQQTTKLKEYTEFEHINLLHDIILRSEVEVAKYRKLSK